MKKIAKSLTALLMAAALCSCSRIPDYSAPESTGGGSESTDAAVNSRPDVVPQDGEYLPKEYTIVSQDYTAKLNAEGGVYDIGSDVSGEDAGLYDGKGFVRLKENGTLTHIVTASAPQHYRIIIAARSEKGASVTLRCAGKTQGAYYIPPLDEDKFEDGSYTFEYYAVDNVYLNSGSNTLEFISSSGEADIDYLFVENSTAVKDRCYGVGTACADPNASPKAIELMQYLAKNFGTQVLTAQNVTPGTNAEIDAIFKETERYPAIRVGELAAAVLEDGDDLEAVKEDVELSRQWSKDGGIVAYTWHWYSPNVLRGTAPRDFSADRALEPVNLDELALLNEDDMQTMLDNGFISAELGDMLKDLDRLAELLKPLSDADIPVIFEPVPDADSGLYWWGNDPENYGKLWRLVFNRLCIYHRLGNLLWVWNGSSTDFYPGDDYVDIIGQSFYEQSDSSFAGRFTALSEMDTARRLQTVTECDVLLDVDCMYRDNALWLWVAPASGEFVVDSSGSLVETYNKRSALKYFYNHKLTIARDELW
ncbi:MAG: hypothetical protein NC401_19320 [Ruminococcus sp.]|nr:hypothetical protein [Ruminococcus sp.]